jgi:2-dehydropantoate 2-reductase
VHGCTSTEGVGSCDLVIIATKAAGAQAAARSALPLLGPSASVQTIQNGLGSADRVAAIIDPDRVAVGVVGGFGASLRAPGHVHHNGMEMVRFGAYAGLPRTELEAGAEVWRSAGFEVALFDNVDRMVWEKLIMNVAFSATSCLTGMTIGQVLSEPNAWQVARQCALEAVEVATARGVKRTSRLPAFGKGAKSRVVAVLVSVMVYLRYLVWTSVGRAPSCRPGRYA